MIKKRRDGVFSDYQYKIIGSYCMDVDKLSLILGFSDSNKENNFPFSPTKIKYDLSPKVH